MSVHIHACICVCVCVHEHISSASAEIVLFFKLEEEESIPATLDNIALTAPISCSERLHAHSCDPTWRVDDDWAPRWTK